MTALLTFEDVAKSFTLHLRGGIVLPLRGADSNGVLPPITPKGPPTMQHLRVIGIRLSIAAALVAAALPVGGWKWGG